MRIFPRCVAVAVVLGAFTLAGCGGGPQSASTSAFIPVAHAKPAFSKNGKYWVLTDLGTGLPGSPGLVPLAINDKGTVVGTASYFILGSLPSCNPNACGLNEGWVYRNGKLRQLPSLGTDYLTFADDINNSGTISGGSGTSETEEAVLWNTNGTITNLGSGIANPNSQAEAIGISNSGKVVGISLDVDPYGNINKEIPTAFHGNDIYSTPCGSSASGYLIAVNDSGLAAGVVFPAGSSSSGASDAVTCAPLKVIAGSVAGVSGTEEATANDLNDAGVLAVNRTGATLGIGHAFLYRNGSATNLGTLFPRNPAAISAAASINKAGAIVGYSAASVGYPAPMDSRAYVYAHGEMINLNSLLAPDIASNWTLAFASGINDKGQIVGEAYVGGYPNGVEHGFLLSPPGLGGNAATVHVAKQPLHAINVGISRQRLRQSQILKVRSIHRALLAQP